MVQIIGYHTTRFGEWWEESLLSLINQTYTGILEQTQLDKKQIDAVFFSNMLAGILENNLHLTAKLAELLGNNIPIFRTEAACASGGVAFFLACNYLKANPNKTVLVIGAEKMTDFSPEQTTTALISAASGEEQEAGLSFPGLYAMLAQVYLQKYQATEEDLAYIAYKNHYHGSLNDKAHFQNKVSLSTILNSAYIAYPLKVFDCAPISDGACALLLTNKKNNYQLPAVRVLASEVATDTISLTKRQRLDEIKATKIAAEKAFKTALLLRKDIQLAEVHDCFTIAEILALEDLGFWPKGQGGKKARELSTLIGRGELVVNTSGGLKAGGHPVGATGIKQLGEIYLQLTHQAQKRQLKKISYGLAHNVGGSGGTAVVTILGV
jgi:acetyl-CoA C-acetyltransferase